MTEMTFSDITGLVLLVGAALALVAGLLSLISVEEKVAEERLLPDFGLEPLPTTLLDRH